LMTGSSSSDYAAISNAKLVRFELECGDRAPAS
jgi:hypothetical protein